MAELLEEIETTPALPPGKPSLLSESPSVKPSAILQKPKSAPPLAPIERRLRQKLNRGQMSVDAKIDLHGMRQEEAHMALLNFIHRTHQHGAGLVLVVTGKGGRKGTSSSHGSEFYETGILRRLVPLWLSDASMRRFVIGFEEASLTHGGSGALYVRIRRIKA